VCFSQWRWAIVIRTTVWGEDWAGMHLGGGCWLGHHYWHMVMPPMTRSEADKHSCSHARIGDLRGNLHWGRIFGWVFGMAIRWRADGRYGLAMVGITYPMWQYDICTNFVSGFRRRDAKHLCEASYDTV